MSAEIGWKFPPTGGGQTDGWNHPGIGHFRGTLYESLARETIQNSLDAVLDRQNPVSVVFELSDLDSSDFDGSDLSETISACLSAIKDEDDPAKSALQIARNTVGKEKVPCLCISDRNTTGLRGRHWETLVKAQGHSYKPDSNGAGGSHGIGKYAPFAVSDLRTVFYWSCFEEDDRLQEKFQGKSILITHRDGNEEAQGTGFYGMKFDCREMTGYDRIPNAFRVIGGNGKPITGTKLTIAGFLQDGEKWREKIADSVLASFFCAIDSGKLSVTLEPTSDGCSDDDEDEIDINARTLDEWFRKRLGSDSNREDGRDSNAVRNANIYRRATKAETVAERQDQDLGHCKLWVHVDDGNQKLPRRVALVRLTGMLITDQQGKLKQFRGHRNFAAICKFEDPKGNNLLRRMENERHDQFEPDRLPAAERQKGRRALERIARWIREEIRKVAGPSREGHQTVLDELAAYLPLFEDQEEVFDGDGVDDERELGFGERITVKLRPARLPAPSSLPTETSEGGDGGDGKDIGNEGGGGSGDFGGEGGGAGTGEGDGRGGSGGRGGGGTEQQVIPVSRVRLLPIRGRQNRYLLSFEVDFDGLASLTLEEAGDSASIPRSDLEAVNGGPSLRRMPVVRGKRNSIEITAQKPVADRAWRLSAVAASEKSA